MKNPAAVPTLLRIVEQPDPWVKLSEVKKEAIRALGEIGSAEAIPALLAILSWFNPTVRAVREELYQFTADWVMDDTKYRSAFGVGETPVTEAIATTVDWYRTHSKN